MNIDKYKKLMQNFDENGKLDISLFANEDLELLTVLLEIVNNNSDLKIDIKNNYIITLDGYRRTKLKAFICKEGAENEE
jgi:hypothetical protein